MKLLGVGINAHNLLNPAEAAAWKTCFNVKLGPHGVDLALDLWGARLFPGSAGEKAWDYAEWLGVQASTRSGISDMLNEAEAVEGAAGVLILADDRDPICDRRGQLCLNPAVDRWSLTPIVVVDELVEGDGVRPGLIRFKAALFEATRA